MQQFVLVGSQGSFAVPAGESRIGSDAACQICIRGDGVLPVHAYLSSDGEKVLIRPADISSSSSADAATIAINGKPLNGPTNLIGGQELSLGHVQMRLLAGLERKPSLIRRRWFQRTLWGVGIVAVLLAVAYAVLTWVILDESRLKLKISKQIAKVLLREDEPGEETIVVRPFQGELEIRQIRIKDRYVGSADSAFILIPSLTAKMAVWPLLRSGFKEYTDLNIVVNRPEINLERLHGGTLNIDDILKSISERIARSTANGGGGGDLGLEKLSFMLTINDGTIRLSDNVHGTGEWLQNVNVVLKQPGPGQPLEIVKFDAREGATPALSREGKLSLSGRLNLLDASCAIDFSKLSTEKLQLDLVDFDVARLSEHFGYAWEPYNKDIKVVPGKPYSGQITLALADPQHLTLNGNVKSESLVSIVDIANNQPPLGNIPMSLDFTVKSLNAGQGFLPQDVDVTLRCGPKPNTTGDSFLKLRVFGRTNVAGGINYTGDLVCQAEQLLDTDVGQRLGLEGRFGGLLKGKATLFSENGSLNIDVKLNSEDSYVMIDDPAAEKLPTEKRKRIRQELPINFNCRANAQPGENGHYTHALVDNFGFSAPSIRADSLVPVDIFWDAAGALNAGAKFKLDLNGQQFSQNFAPMLKLFGYSVPQEQLNLVVLLSGKGDQISIAANGTAARQWKPDDPSPVELISVLDIYPHPKLVNGKQQPYLSLYLEVASKVGKPLNVHLKADCTRDDKTETIGLGTYDKDPEHPDSFDVAALRERFNPYIESYLANYDALQKDHDGRIIRFYRDTVLNGSLKPSGRVSLQRVLDPKSKDNNRIDFEMNIAGKDFKIEMPYKGARPADDHGAPGTFTEGRWSWAEDHASVSVKGTFLQRQSGTKEEPDVQRLNIDALNVEGSLGKFNVSMRDFDIFKLANLSVFKDQTWTDTLAGLTMAGQVNPPAYDFLRTLNIIPPEYPVSGNLVLQIAYDREKDTLDLQNFDFKQLKEKPDFFLSGLDVTGAVLKVRELSARLLPVADGAPPFTENLSALIDDGGPAALLDHLGDNLTVKSLQVESRPLVEWLCKDYRKPQPNHPPPALIASLIRRDWQPEGTWSAVGLQLSRIGDPKIRTWKLLGGRLRNDFTVYGAEPKPGAQRPAVFNFSHDWELKMGLALAADNTVAMNGNLLFDNAFINAQIPALKYEYKKPAKEKCELQLKDCLYSHGRHALAHVGSLELKGQPLTLALTGFDVDITQQQPGNFKINELLVAGGPLPCSASNLQYDPVADRLDMHIHSVDADLNYLASILNFTPDLHVKGALKDADLFYRGSLIAFQNSFLSPTELAAKFPELKPDDPRLKGLNPEADSLELDAQLKDVSLALGTDENGVKAALGGTLHLTGRDLIWKELTADVDCLQPGGAVKQSFTMPNLHVNSLDAKLSLARAFRAPGMPLDISLPVSFSTPLNVNALFRAHDHLFSMVGLTPPIAENAERKFAALNQLAVSGSLKAPALIAGHTTHSFVELPEFTWKNLKISYPVLTVSLFGGKLTFSDADCDLTKARLLNTNGELAVRGVEHHEQLKLLDADLNAVLGLGEPKGGYAVSGRAEMQGTLQGSDFDLENRLTWNGGMKFRFSNLAVKRIPAAQLAKADALPAWQSSYLNGGDKFANAYALAAGHDAVSSDAANADLVASGPIRNVNGLLVGLDAYLSKAFGFEQEHWEFDPVTVTVVIRQGVASAQPFQMTGKGDTSGLDLRVANLGVILTDETLAETSVYPTTLPQSARARLSIANWAVQSNAYFARMAKGDIPLKIAGTAATPTLKFPWADVRDEARQALFGLKSMEDLTALDTGRQNFLRNWPLPEDHENAAKLADRMGAGLPGTTGSHIQGEMIIERIPGLPTSLKKTLNYIDKGISPKESLELMLNPPPDAPLIPVAPNGPNGTGPKK